MRHTLLAGTLSPSQSATFPISLPTAILARCRPDREAFGAPLESRTQIQLTKHLLLAHMDFRSERLRIAGARVAHRSEHHHLAEAGRPELIKDGHAFLGSRNSGEPVLVAGTGFGWKWLTEDQLRGIDGAPGTHHSRQLGEDRFTRGIEVEHAIDQRHINRAALEGQAFGRGLTETEIARARLARSSIAAAAEYAARTAVRSRAAHSESSFGRASTRSMLAGSSRCATQNPAIRL